MIHLHKTSPAFLFILSLLTSGCVFLPKTVEDDTSCQLATPSWELSYEQLGSNFNGCSGTSDATLACLVAVGVVVPVGSILVSGSIVLVGNTIHWLEYQGQCDDGMIRQALQELRSDKDED